jgi:hypothetical protein
MGRAVGCYHGGDKIGLVFTSFIVEKRRGDTDGIMDLPQSVLLIVIKSGSPVRKVFYGMD